MMLRRGGFRFFSGRPVPPKADAEQQRAFVADFEALLTSRLGSEALAVETWFQDEARGGKKRMATRVWARGKQRVVRNHRYVYLFGATCAALALPIWRANTVSMNEHLTAIAVARARRDRAGRRRLASRSSHSS